MNILEMFKENGKNEFVPVLRKQSSKTSNISKMVHRMRVLLGLLVKRFHYARRSRKAIFYQIMLPAFFICIAMSIALSLPSSTGSVPLVLSLAQFSTLTHSRENFIPYSDQSAFYPVEREYAQVDSNATRIIDTFYLPSGLGGACVVKINTRSLFDWLKSDHGHLKVSDKEMFSRYFSPDCSIFTSLSDSEISTSSFLSLLNNHSDNGMKKLSNVPCSCTEEGNTYVCTKNIDQFSFKSTAFSGEHLINITGQVPILPYLIYTTKDYKHHRYGAFSLNEIRENFKERSPDFPPEMRKLSVREATQIFFNRRGYHSMPTYLNVFNNALLRANLPPSKGDPSQFGITVTNHPMNKTVGSLSLDFLISGTDVVIAVFIIVAMSFVPASFLVFLVTENQSKAKHLQFISGAEPSTYWLSNYMWDMLNYLFPATVCILILVLFGLPAYTRGNNMYAVIALFLLYGWSMTPMMYPASFYFTVPSTAYIVMIVINLFVGITTVVTTFMISLFNTNPELKSINEKLQVFFLVFPNYNLGKGLMDLSYYEFINQFYHSTGQFHKIRDPFEWDIITRSMLSMLLFGVAGFIITYLCEVRFFTRVGIGKKKSLSSSSLHQFEDIDVAKERGRVDRISPLVRDEHLIVVDNVCKVFKGNRGRTTAVDGLSFVVSAGECFGLLGVNGAGKTTTFQMITGGLNVTSGNIRVAGHIITGGRSHERLLAQQSTGYCPQFDALFDELTPIEHLRLYARLRGVPKKNENQVVDWAIEKLDLTNHQHKPALHLSGGNRRKLSVAVALVGNPPVVLLDEPTAGMDPGARRFLWNLIRDLTRSGRAVLLTSHSMEECEVLCSRIAIMVNGKFKCLGPTQHLKNRFGNGYMVSVRSTEPDLFVDAFKIEFPLAVLKEQHYHKAVFQIVFSEGGNNLMSLATVFKMLEERKKELKIEDYSVNQTTLDDVFINFARKQGDVETKKSYLNSLKRVKIMLSRVARWFMDRLLCCDLAPGRAPLTEDDNIDDEQP